MAAYSAMTPQERETVAHGARQMHSAAEMRQYVASLRGGRI